MDTLLLDLPYDVKYVVEYAKSSRRCACSFTLAFRGDQSIQSEPRNSISIVGKFPTRELSILTNTQPFPGLSYHRSNDSFWLDFPVFRFDKVCSNTDTIQTIRILSMLFTRWLLSLRGGALWRQRVV